MGRKRKIIEKPKAIQLERPGCRRFILKLLEQGVSLKDIAKKNYERINKKRHCIHISDNVCKQAVRMLSRGFPEKVFKCKLYHKKHYREVRLNVLECYGGEHPCCELMKKYPDTCGGDNLDLLTIDHEGGHGIDHHREINRGNIYYWLTKNNYPEGYTDKNGISHRFRLLCHNCNHLERLRLQEEKDKEFFNSLFKNF